MQFDVNTLKTNKKTRTAMYGSWFCEIISLKSHIKYPTSKNLPAIS